MLEILVIYSFTNNDRMSTQDHDLMSQITIQYHFTDIEEPTYETIKNDVSYFLRTKAHSYLKSELKHPDSEMLINMSLAKTKQGLFEGSFLFDIKNGSTPIRYHTERPFKHLDDVISHAFQHLKEQLSSKK